MFLLPLGFGTRLPVFPAMTFILSFVIVALSTWHFPQIKAYERQIIANEVSHIKPLRQKIAIKACEIYTKKSAACSKIGRGKDLKPDDLKNFPSEMRENSASRWHNRWAKTKVISLRDQE